MSLKLIEHKLYTEPNYIKIGIYLGSPNSHEHCTLIKCDVEI